MKKETKARAKRAAKPAATGAELAVYSMKGEKTGTIALPEAVFSAPWKSDLVHQVVTAMQANARLSRAHTKDRSEVSGGGKKPWKQKGTGQARHGSTRSPIWRHGGVTFGPRKERDYGEKINRRMRAGALFSVLSKKAKDGEVVLIDKFAFAAPKTKEAFGALAAVSKASGMRLLSNKGRSALVALSSYDGNTLKSVRNLRGVATEEVRNLNPVDVLAHRYLVIENPEAAFKTLASRITK